MSKLGIIGGTFDPPHYAHLAIAEEAFVRLELSKVLFAPAYGNPLKQGRDAAPPEHRLRMVELAVADNPHFAVTTLDLQPGPSYTVHLLERLKVAYPQDELYFIIGYDALRRLPEWYEAAKVLELAYMIACHRPDNRLDMDALAARLPAARERVKIIESGPLLDISATELRRRVSANLPIRYQTPEAVVDYIQKQGLYHQGFSSGS